MAFCTSNGMLVCVHNQQKMADKAIRVAVLGGDFASLCALGFPLSLGIQLQQSCLKLSEAHWTARSTSGGFSVSFFWPAPENVENKSEVQSKKKRRKRKRRQRDKAKAQVIATTPPKQSATTEPPKPKLTSVTPDETRQDDEHESVCASSLSPPVDESTWTQVSRKRRRPRLPPCWKLRFPVHLHSTLKTPSESGTESEDEDPVRLLEVLSSLRLLQQELDPGQNLRFNRNDRYWACTRLAFVAIVCPLLNCKKYYRQKKACA